MGENVRPRGILGGYGKSYVTYDNDYIESVWWSLKQIHEKGLLYKGHKVVPYCPAAEPPFPPMEVAQGIRT